MKPDKIYLIHYTKLTERLSAIKNILDKTDVPYEIITEYDKELMTSDVMDVFYSKNKPQFEEKTNSLWGFGLHKFRELNLPEISCTIKHFSAINKLSKECDNFGMILEDDVVFAPDFANRFSEYFKETPNDWDAVFLGLGCGEEYQINRLQNSVRHGSYCFKMKHPATNCAEAYLLKPQIAGKIVETGVPFHLVSDWEIAYQLFKHDAQVYWWVPSIVGQGSKLGMFKSELDLGQR